MAEFDKNVRSYEISIWTLQDSFVTVLKPSELEHKGQIQNGIVELCDDGTETLNFSIPMYYNVDGTYIMNPLWTYVYEGHLVANMHKVKLIFNKCGNDFTILNMREISDLPSDQEIYEFLVTSVTETHEQDNIMYAISCEGLAFHELGKLGYKIYLSGEDFDEEYIEWFKHDLGEESEAPRQTIQYWNDKVFYYVDEEGVKHRKYEWDYEVQMDWSAYSAYKDKNRDPHKVYEEEFVSSWEIDHVTDELFPSNVERFREKWRAVEIGESNIYNITQTIAEKFGVYCRYKYIHDDHYHIIGKKVIYYNNNYQDSQKHIDITYPYSTSSVERTIDNSELTTKLFVRPIDSDVSSSNLISIATVEANKSKEDYILNFDYLKKINTITQEQYDAIEVFEFEVSKLNERIRRLDTQIRITKDKLITAEADEAVAVSAIALDKERIDNANMLFNQLTGEDEVIWITEAKPETLFLKTAQETSPDLKMVKLQFEGILADKVSLYKTLNYTRKAGEGRLTDLVTSGQFTYDEFGNPVSITNIYMPDSSVTKLYMTGAYSPRLHYSRVKETWERRLAEDEVKLTDAEDRVERNNLLLYGCDVDYAKATFSRVEFVSAGSSIAEPPESDDDLEWRLENGGLVYNSRGQQVGEYGSYIDEALLEEAHGYILMREIYILKKNILISKFEKMMGPALREGYWDPEDYDDYGNKYNDRWWITEKTTQIWPGVMRPDIIDFIWDTYNRFEEESKIWYEVGINQDKEFYLLIDLTNHLDRIKDYIANNRLSFIYYDQVMLGLNNDLDQKDQRMVELQNKSNRTEDEQVELNALTVNYQVRQDSRARNLKNAVRWLTAGSTCEFGYVWHNDKYKPVLVLTGLKDLTVLEQRSIFSAMPGYEPYLGYVSTNVVETKDDQGATHSNVEVTVQRLNAASTDIMDDYLNVFERDATAQEQYECLERAGYHAYLGAGRTGDFYSGAITNFWNEYAQNKTEMDKVNTYPWPIESYKKVAMCYDRDPSIENAPVIVKQAFPRIRVNSLELNQSSVLLAVNKRALENYKDFYILIEPDAANDTEKHFITIKPEVLIAQGNVDLVIDIDYAISNAAEAVYLDALKVSKENAYPKVSYVVGLNMLNPDLIRTAFTLLRRVVYINDVDLLLDDVAGYISKITLDLDHPWQDEVEVKNYETKFEDLFSTIVAQTESMKKSESTLSFAAAAFTGAGTISQQVLQESMLKADLDYSFNQGTLTIDEKNGIWATSDVGVVAIRGGGIFTATETDSSGNWKWNTGILPSGINADLITTGQLDTNKINIYAGDKVRFQMNGQGIFAYKALFSDQEVIANDIVSQYTQNGDIDAAQFIRYNEDGLFLVAKKGAMILNDARNDFVTIGENLEHPLVDGELRRVELGWNGLILRNWKNEDVFYANAETGDLTIAGTIYTGNGDIGGWTISPNSLTSKNVSLYSSENNQGFSGIRLSAKESQTINYNGNTYYAYKIKDSEDTTIYYNSQLAPNEELTLNNSNKTCLYYASVIRGVSPKRVTTDTTGNSYIADPATGDAIMYNNSRILFNNNTSTDSLWYTNLTSWVNNNHYDIEDYVTFAMGSDLVSTDLEVGTILLLDSDSPSFMANAIDGSVIIRKGTLGDIENGGFTLKSNGLYDGSLNNVLINPNSRVGYSTRNYALSGYENCFNGWSTSGDHSSFTLTRVNGGVVNFNIADASYFITKMREAAAIQVRYGLREIGQQDGAKVEVSVYTSASAGSHSYGSDYTPTPIDVGHLYTEGDAAGYTRGEAAGYASGYADGLADGKSIGYASGWQAGFDEVIDTIEVGINLTLDSNPSNPGQATATAYAEASAYGEVRDTATVTKTIDTI